MDSIRGMFSFGIAQLMVLSVMVPAYADSSDDDDEHRRTHARRHSSVVSHNREDYPVIANWLTSPDSPEGNTPQNDAK